MTTTAGLDSLALRLDRPVRAQRPPAAGEALVRYVDAEAQAPFAERLAPDVLDADERRRADRFVRPQDRGSYLVAHVALRLLLGALLDTAPRDLAMTREACPECGGPDGRPALVGGRAHFSLSHSRDAVFLACASTPVGVDVEALPAPRVVAQSEEFFHPAESAELAALPEAGRAAAFARLWARKEAHLKGTGAGLGHEGNRNYLGTGPAGDSVRPHWSLTDLPAPEGYAAALALRAPSARWRRDPPDTA
ncbi:4'-phosphopantetheinyl transferase family protein [Streptomyces spororaveus]|uniref:4'-phosphopantetheinyl transferase family protein n=1 Tax=Streptomyces spororaveus TaxID=284039 RepID=UPI0036B348F3